MNSFHFEWGIESLMHKIIFICTANIFRSRFSEEVYNFLAKKNNLSSRAFSAGLKVGNYMTRKMYKPALKQLEILNIEPKRAHENSIHVDNINLDDYKKIVCMDKKEHMPMVKLNKNLNKYSIEYWNIVDIPEVKSDVSLPLCYKNVEYLISKIKKNLK